MYKTQRHLYSYSKKQSSSDYKPVDYEDPIIYRQQTTTNPNHRRTSDENYPQMIHQTQTMRPDFAALTNSLGSLSNGEEYELNSGGRTWKESQVNHPTDHMLHNGVVEGVPITRLLMVYDDDDFEDSESEQTAEELVNQQFSKENQPFLDDSTIKLRKGPASPKTKGEVPYESSAAGDSKDFSFAKNRLYSARQHQQQQQQDRRSGSKQNYYQQVSQSPLLQEQRQEMSGYEAGSFGDDQESYEMQQQPNQHHHTAASVPSQMVGGGRREKQLMFPQQQSKSGSKALYQKSMGQGSNSLQKYKRAQIQFSKPFSRDKTTLSKTLQAPRKSLPQAPKKMKSTLRPPSTNRIGSDSSNGNQGKNMMAFQEQMALLQSAEQLTYSEEELMILQKQRAFKKNQSSSTQSIMQRKNSYETIDNLSQLLLAKRMDMQKVQMTHQPTRHGSPQKAQNVTDIMMNAGGPYEKEFNSRQTIQVAQDPSDNYQVGYQSNLSNYKKQTTRKFLGAQTALLERRMTTQQATRPIEQEDLFAAKYTPQQMLGRMTMQNCQEDEAMEFNIRQKQQNFPTEYRSSQQQSQSAIRQKKRIQGGGSSKRDSSVEQSFNHFHSGGHHTSRKQTIGVIDEQRMKSPQQQQQQLFQNSTNRGGTKMVKDSSRYVQAPGKKKKGIVSRTIQNVKEPRFELMDIDESSLQDDATYNDDEDEVDSYDHHQMTAAAAAAKPQVQSHRRLVKVRNKSKGRDRSTSTQKQAAPQSYRDKLAKNMMMTIQDFKQAERVQKKSIDPLNGYDLSAYTPRHPHVLDRIGTNLSATSRRQLASTRASLSHGKNFFSAPRKPQEPSPYIATSNDSGVAQLKNRIDRPQSHYTKQLSKTAMKQQKSGGLQPQRDPIRSHSGLEPKLRGTQQHQQQQRQQFSSEKQYLQHHHHGAPPQQQRHDLGQRMQEMLQDVDPEQRRQLLQNLYMQQQHDEEEEEDQEQMMTYDEVESGEDQFHRY